MTDDPPPPPVEPTTPVAAVPVPAAPPPAPSLAPAPKKSGLPLVATLGIWALACVALAVLALGIGSFLPNLLPSQLTNPQNTQVAVGPTVTTVLVLLPTTTPAPPATATPEPTATAVPATATTESSPTATAGGPTSVATSAPANLTPTGLQLQVLSSIPGANVRNGPSTSYAILGGLSAGAVADVLGRDSSSHWLVIPFAGGTQGRGWISVNVVDFNGNISALPVIAGPPPPPATATAKPGSGDGVVVTGARGMQGKLTLCTGGKTTFAVNERICFVEWIKNTTASPIAWSVIGVGAANQGGGPSQFQTSWDGGLAEGGLLGTDAGCLGPTDRCKGEWEDGIRITTPGTYRLTLQICYSPYSECLTGGAWETLSGGIIVTVQ